MWIFMKEDQNDYIIISKWIISKYLRILWWLLTYDIQQYKIDT